MLRRVKNVFRSVLGKPPIGDASTRPQYMLGLMPKEEVEYVLARVAALPAESVLRAPAEEVRPEDTDSDKVRDCIKALEHCMRRGDAVVLAGPQVGHSLSVLALNRARIKINDTGKPEPPMTWRSTEYLFNAKIKPVGRDTEMGHEYSYCFPGYYGVVPRYREVDAEFMTKDGKIVKERCTGLLSRAFQNAVNHLEGVMYTDLVQHNQLRKVPDNVRMIGLRELPGVVTVDEELNKYNVKLPQKKTDTEKKE